MANPFIVHPLLSDAGTITAGNELSTLPATNLLNMQPSRRTRTSGLGSVWYQIDLGSAKAINFIGLLSHNAAAADTWQVRASSDGTPATSPDYDSGSLNMYPSATKPSDGLFTRFHSFHLPTATQTWRYWRVDVTSAAAEGYFEAGRLVIGYRQDLVIQFGFGRGHDPADVAEVTPWGGMLTEGRGRPRVWTFDNEAFTEADEMVLHTIDGLCGLAQDVVVCEDPNATTYLHIKTMQATIRTASQIIRPTFGLRLKNYVLREVL